MAKKKKTKVGSFLSNAANAVKNAVNKVTSGSINLGANASGAFNSQPVFKARVGEGLSGAAKEAAIAKVSPSTAASNKAIASIGKTSSLNLSQATKSGGLTFSNTNSPAITNLGKTSSLTSGKSSGGKSSSPTTATSSLSRSTAPSSADGISSFSSSGETSLSTRSPSMGNPGGAVASTIGAQTKQDIYKEARDAENLRLQEELKLQQKENKSFLESVLGKKPKTEEIREDAYEDIGVDPTEYFADQKSRIAEIDALNQQYAQLVAAKDQQIAQSQDKLASMNFINNQTQQIERNAAPQLAYLSANINSKAATLQALQGNFNEARSFVNQAVEDSLSDWKYEVDLRLDFKDKNDALLKEVRSEYSKAFYENLDIKMQEYDEARAEKEQVGELLLEYNRYGANISTNDSLEEATRKAAKVNPVKSSGGSGSKADEELRQNIVSYIADIKNGDYTLDEALRELQVLHPDTPVATLRSMLTGQTASSGGMFDSTPVDIGAAVKSGGLTIDGIYNSLFGE